MSDFFGTDNGVFRRSAIWQVSTIQGNDTDLNIRWKDGSTSRWIAESQEERDAELQMFKRALMGDEGMLTIVPGKPGEDDVEREDVKELRKEIEELKKANKSLQADVYKFQAMIYGGNYRTIGR